MHASDILGVVLAGGAGRRLGLDKARLEWSGSTLTERAAGALRPVCAEVVVAGPSSLALPGLEAIADLYPGRGPLAGVHAGLERAGGRAVFILTCDLPLVPAELVAHLAAAGHGRRAGAWVVADERGPQPLCGLYAPGCRAVAARRLEAGELEMVGFLRAVDGVELALTPELPFYRPELLLNLNSPADLERARRIAGAGAVA